MTDAVQSSVPYPGRSAALPLCRSAALPLWVLPLMPGDAYSVL